MSSSSGSSTSPHPSEFPSCDYALVCVMRVACTGDKDRCKYFRCQKGGCNYFSLVDEEDSDILDLKFQLCGLQETLMSRLDALEQKVVCDNVGYSMEKTMALLLKIDLA